MCPGELPRPLVTGGEHLRRSAGMASRGDVVLEVSAEADTRGLLAADSTTPRPAAARGERDRGRGGHSRHLGDDGAGDAAAVARRRPGASGGQQDDDDEYIIVVQNVHKTYLLGIEGVAALRCPHKHQPHTTSLPMLAKFERGILSILPFACLCALSSLSYIYTHTLTHSRPSDLYSPAHRSWMYPRPTQYSVWILAWWCGNCRKNHGMSSCPAQLLPSVHVAAGAETRRSMM